MPSKQMFRVKKIFSPNAEVLENATITVEKGMVSKITTKKSRSKVAQSKITDFSNYYAYPGFIDAHSHITVSGDGVGEPGMDSNEYSDAITPHLHIRDSINLDTRELTLAREEGIVAAAIFPGSANLIGGMTTLIKTTCRSLITNDAIVRDDIGLKMALGENPKRVFSSQKKFYTRMGAIAQLNLYFQEVVSYSRKKRKEENLKYEIGQRLLSKEFPARIHAHQANDIQSAVQLGEKWGFDVVIEHGTEADKIADYLRPKRIPVVVGPIAYRSGKIETRNRDVATAGRLSNAGVLTAISCDAPVYNIMLLRYLAGVAIKAGMKYFDALKALTTIPAAICQVADRYGDICENHEAHFVVWDGDPLCDMQAQVVAIVDGDDLWQIRSYATDKI